MLSEPMSPIRPSVPSGVGDFEVVDYEESTPAYNLDQMAQHADKTLTSAKKVMNTKPVEDALHSLISQSRIIISTIPQNYKRLERYKLQYHTNAKFPADMKEAIREQRNNIAKLQVACDEPLKKQRFISRFNPEEYKEAISLCKLFTPTLKHYDSVLEKLFFGDATALIQTYEISHMLDDISRKLPVQGMLPTQGMLSQGGKKRKTKKRRTHKKRSTHKKRHTHKKRRTRKRRGGLSSVQMLEEIKKELRGNISPRLYQCLIRNSVIEKFINKQNRLGWNYTPGELVGIILRDNINC